MHLHKAAAIACIITATSANAQVTCTNERTGQSWDYGAIQCCTPHQEDCPPDWPPCIPPEYTQSRAEHFRKMLEEVINAHEAPTGSEPFGIVGHTLYSDDYFLVPTQRWDDHDHRNVEDLIQTIINSGKSVWTP